MPANQVILHSHHVIEQDVFRDHLLLNKLTEHGLIDEHASANRLYLPVDGKLADAIETSPHRGRTRSSYTDGVTDVLNRLEKSDVGQAALDDDQVALRKIATQVHDLRDTLKIALINGDAFATTPDRLTKAETNAQNRSTISDIDQYRTAHADQLKTLRSMSNVESEWAAVTHSEQRIATVIDVARTTGRNLVGVPREPDVLAREIAGREEFRMAIAHAEDAGRVTLSESNAALVQQVLDDTPTTIGGAARSIRQGAAATPHAPYTPVSQRGFATAELLAGDLSAGQALRTAGLLATAADTVMTGQRATHSLGQNNPLAAQSELAHFAGRNVGGWAGGTAAAYALGSSGAGPMVLIAADAYFLGAAGEKAAALLDNRAIYTQTDREGTQWSFNGIAWAREGKADTTNDGIDNPTSTPIVASYEKARELNYQATNAAAALALKDAPAPQDPYRQPANATDRPSLSIADWRRDATDGQWHRLGKAEIAGANDRGSYVQETALPHRKAELDAQAQEVIARNIANSPGAIAARYELAHHRSGWAADGLPMSPAVQQALPDPDALTASNGQRYYRNIEGQWTSNGAPPDGNRVLELETTRAMLQPALAEQAQAIAAIRQSPQDVQGEQTLYRYRIVGTELQPQWREAIELATQRTREAEGLAGDGAMQLQRGPGGTFGADSPIAHLQRGPDGVERIAAVTSTEDIHQALQEVQARQNPALPIQQLASAPRSSDGSADADTSSSAPSNQHALDVQARGQAASAAQERQERQQEDRQAQDQQLAQARAHTRQEQTSHEERAQDAQALQAHALQELRRQESQQLEQQERQTQAAQQREQVQQQAHDTQQRERAQQQAQETQQREQETRQAQDDQQSQQERLQAQTVQHPEQQPLHAQAAPQREQEPAQEAVSREPSSLHAQDTSPRQPEQPSTPDDVAQRPKERVAEPAQAQASDLAQQRTQSQQAQEERPQEAQQQTAQSAAIAQTAPADQQQVAELHSGPRPMTAQASDAHQDAPAQQPEQPADAYLAQAAPTHSAPSLATPVAAEQRDEQQARTPQAQALEAPDTPAALPVSAHLAQATVPSLDMPTAGRSADAPEDAADAREPLSAYLADEHDRPAAVPVDPNSWEEIERSMRELRIQLEQELETENRVAEARQARVDRGERPFTELELREGYDPDGPSGLRPPRTPPADTAPQSLAAGEQEDRPQPQRKSITGDPDVDELLYAIDCKNELAIEQALKRVANSPYSQALAKQGHEFLDAQAMQEAQEQANTRQALNMDVSTEVQT
ncbi:AHH domain-containing protein, partial [Xanthomonas citri]